MQTKPDAQFPLHDSFIFGGPHRLQLTSAITARILAIYLHIATPIENTGWFLECKPLTHACIKMRKTISDTRGRSMLVSVSSFHASSSPSSCDASSHSRTRAS